MTALGIPPRKGAIIAFVLAILGAAGTVAGMFSSAEWVMVGVLVLVGFVNLRRAQTEAHRGADDRRGP